MLPRKQAIKSCFIFPPHLTGIFTLPGETGNPEVVFTEMLYAVLSTDAKQSVHL